MSSGVAPLAVKIDTEMKDRIKRLADSKHRSSHWLMREAIREYVEREERREALRQDAVRGWQEYQETGLYVSGEEVTDWLKSWGTAKEKAVPECHK